MRARVRVRRIRKKEATYLNARGYSLDHRTIDIPHAYVYLFKSKIRETTAEAKHRCSLYRERAKFVKLSSLDAIPPTYLALELDVLSIGTIYIYIYIYIYISYIYIYIKCTLCDATDARYRGIAQKPHADATA
jgi:hypothetical protein